MLVCFYRFVHNFLLNIIINLLSLNIFLHEGQVSESKTRVSALINRFNDDFGLPLISLSQNGHNLNLIIFFKKIYQSILNSFTFC